MGAVELQGVRKLFGQLEVIKGVDLMVADKELAVSWAHRAVANPPFCA